MHRDDQLQLDSTDEAITRALLQRDERAIESLLSYCEEQMRAADRRARRRVRGRR